MSHVDFDIHNTINLTQEDGAYCPYLLDRVAKNK